MPVHYNTMLLCRTSYASQIGCGVSFDLRRPILEPPPGNPWNELLQTKATYNPTCFLQITFEPFPGMHYDIPVTSHKDPITIKTIINSLYAFFQLPLSQRDLQLLGEGQRAHVDEAYHRRVWKHEADPYTPEGGYKMLDLLLEDFIFHGLESGVHNDLPQWKLVLERNYPLHQYEVAIESIGYPSYLLFQKRDPNDIFSRRTYMPGNAPRSQAVMVPLPNPIFLENKVIQEPRSAPQIDIWRLPPMSSHQSRLIGPSDGQPLRTTTTQFLQRPLPALSRNMSRAESLQPTARSQGRSTQYPVAFVPPDPRVCSPWATSSNP